MTTANIVGGVVVAPIISFAVHTMDLPTLASTCMYVAAAAWYCVQIYQMLRNKRAHK